MATYEIYKYRVYTFRTIYKEHAVYSIKLHSIGFLSRRNQNKHCLWIKKIRIYGSE